MELKNAVAVCLIALFSATLVVLIARYLDSQAASRLEPQLARIIEELEAIRSSGGIVTSQPATGQDQSLHDGLIVYYFHSNTRCPTCRAIESQARETVQTDFAEQLDRGAIVWKTINYEESTTSELAAKFEIQMPVVVLARKKEGQIEGWNRLDEVWGLVGDKPAFAEYLRHEIHEMLDASDQDPLGSTACQWPGDFRFPAVKRMICRFQPVQPRFQFQNEIGHSQLTRTEETDDTCYCGHTRGCYSCGNVRFDGPVLLIRPPIASSRCTSIGQSGVQPALRWAAIPRKLSRRDSRSRSRKDP